MKNKKEINAWDVLDGLWDFIQTDKISEVKGMDWADNVKYIMKSENISDFSIEEGVKKFMYEKDYFFKKPNRSTMKWLWGSHVELFDVWGCEKHRFTIRTSDSYDEMIDGQTICCPFCNVEIMTDKDFKKYCEQGKTHTPEGWKKIKKTASFHRKWDRKQNLKYIISQIMTKGYLWYKLQYTIKKIFE